MSGRDIVRCQRKSGFTLIELLLVLGMIAVLAAVALPAYSNYRERVRQAQAIQDIQVMQAVIKHYMTDQGSPPASLSQVGNAGRLDPWGRPYVYVNLTTIPGKGMARKDRKLNPINSDFDLYSLGKDGQSKTQLTNKLSLDDVIRANDGAYVGLASDYSPP